MNTNVALKLAPRAASRPVRVTSARKLVRARVVPLPLPLPRRVVRPMLQAVAPSAGARIETVLMGVTFLALAGLAVSMEAVGVLATLVG